ncbi:hypothetical protein BpHYR1_047369 [Brachionus plicatilis]|uniref:Uncharacterized protein n=1 Tax=Brachionus plicatilis TaxID=10195 RepID=A0A3M7PHG2_BRAPC|nr:hypothetical protein BpHYR1_047369 [Brachionus plicatilis]
MYGLSFHSESAVSALSIVPNLISYSFISNLGPTSFRSMSFLFSADFFHNVDAALAQLGREVVENQMRVGLGHGAAIFYIMSHYHIVQCKVSCRSVRQVTYLQGVWLASCFVYYDQIGALIGPACFYQLFCLVVAAVNALRIGKYQFEFFGKLF